VRIVLLACGSMTILAGATIAPALPQMAEVFADKKDAVFLTKLILTLPALIIAVLAPAAGWIADRFGRKKLLLSSLILYGVSGTNGLYVNDLFLILAGRAFLGLGVAGIMTSISTMAADFFEGPERQKFLGLQAAIHSLSGVIFVGVGGFLADISWRMPFSLYALSFVMLPFAFYLLHDTEAHKEAKVLDAPPDLVNRKQISFILTTMVICMIAFYMVPVQLPFYMMEKLQVKNSMIGIAIAVATVSGAITASSYRRIKNHLSYEAIMGIGIFLIAIGYGFISFVQHYDGIISGLAISGLGLGLIMPNINLWLMDSAPISHRGRLMGAMTSSAFSGQFLSPLITEPMVNHYSLRDAFWFVSLAMLVFSIVYLFLVIRNRRRAME